jgi:hypothetical protein
MKTLKKKTAVPSLLLTVSVAVLAWVATTWSGGQPGPLEETYEAHGGLDRWSQQGQMSYRMIGFPLTPQVAKPSRSTVDLRTRRNRIESDGFTVGFDGQHAWSTPGPDAVGLPPRFFSLGSFYFHGMPFVFADPGVILEDMGTATFKGKPYRHVQARFADGVGHSNDDDYNLFIDPKNGRLALINHSVTEIGVDRVTWTFDEWQWANGLLVPARVTYYAGWNPEEPGDGATYVVEDVVFDLNSPADDYYAPPADAVIAD